MKFYPNRVLIDFRGKPCNQTSASDGASVPLTLGALAIEALLGELPQDNNAPGNTKIQRFNLAKEIYKYNGGKETDVAQLSSEEIGLIKTRIFAPGAFSAAIVGPAEVAIEQGDEDVAAVADIKGGKKKG